MRKFLLITLLIALGCSNPLEPTTGSIAVKLIFPEDDSHLSKKLLGAGDPVKIGIYLYTEPERQFMGVKSVPFSAHSGVSEQIDPGDYHLEVLAFDESFKQVLFGQTEVEVKAGQQATVQISLQ